MIAAFYAVIDCIFCYDVDRMDVAQFDTHVRHVSSYRKKPGADQIKIMGRGGTSYQEIIDYAIKHSYDGLIIMTDGFGPIPSFYSNQAGEIGVDNSSPYNLGGKRIFLGRTKMAWVRSDSTGYMKNRRWMEELGIVIPLQGIVLITRKSDDSQENPSGVCRKDLSYLQQKFIAMQISIKEGDLVVTKEITAPNNEYPSAEDALLGAYDVLSRIFGQAAIVRACLRTDPDAMDYTPLRGE